SANAERGRDQDFAIDVGWPSLCERTHQREQNRPARERDPRGPGSHPAAARIDDQGCGCLQFRDLRKAQRLLGAGEEAPGGGAIQGGAYLRNLGNERRHLGALGQLVCARQSGLRIRDAQRSQRQLGMGQFGQRCQRRRPATRIQARQRSRRFVKASKQTQAASRDQPCLRCIGVIRARLERCGSRCQRTRQALQVAHGQRHFGFCDDTTRPRQFFVAAETVDTRLQELARARILAKLRHRNAAQRKRRRIVAQGDSLERGECVAAGERARGGSDQGVHCDRLLKKKGRIARPLFMLVERFLDQPSWSRKLFSRSEREGCRSLRNALASIWRIRSRVTSNCLPTSSSVWSVDISMPKRMRSTFASRGVSVSSTSLVTSRSDPYVAASAGAIVDWSSMKSPRCESSSSPIGVSIEIGSLEILRILRIFSSGISIFSASNAGSGSCPVSCKICREMRFILLIVSIMCTGIRMVRAWSAIDRVIAWRIHHVAYVENLYPRRYSNLSTAF